MRLAILMTNTDESAFSKAHPKDGAKFASFVAMARPEWVCEVFSVKDGVFPETLAGFDGVIVTGSPASVHDDAPWVARLLEVIRQVAAAGMPIFGACFGHQAVAMALGGAVEHSPDGWVLGRVETGVVEVAPWMEPALEHVNLYAAHVEQVTRMPEGARVLTRTVGLSGEGCPVGGFAIGRKVFTSQYHPEMTPGFIAALVEHLDGDLPDAVIARARESLSVEADQAVFAEWVARFFELAG